MPATVPQIHPLMAEPKKPSTKLELLLTTPYYLSPGWLWIDPTFAPLREIATSRLS